MYKLYNICLCFLAQLQNDTWGAFWRYLKVNKFQGSIRFVWMYRIPIHLRHSMVWQNATIYSKFYETAAQRPCQKDQWFRQPLAKFDSRVDGLHLDGLVLVAKWSTQRWKIRVLAGEESSRIKLYLLWLLPGVSCGLLVDMLQVHLNSLSTDEQQTPMLTASKLASRWIQDDCSMWFFHGFAQPVFVHDLLHVNLAMPGLSAQNVGSVPSTPSASRPRSHARHTPVVNPIGSQSFSVSAGTSQITTRVFWQRKIETLVFETFISCLIAQLDMVTLGPTPGHVWMHKLCPKKRDRNVPLRSP